jgi:hypothetical protein
MNYQQLIYIFKIIVYIFFNKLHPFFLHIVCNRNGSDLPKKSPHKGFKKERIQSHSIKLKEVEA